MIEDSDILQERTVLQDVDELGTALVLEHFEPRCAILMVPAVRPVIVVEVEIEMDRTEGLQRDQMTDDVSLCR